MQFIDKFCDKETYSLMHIIFIKKFWFYNFYN